VPCSKGAELVPRPAEHDALPPSVFAVLGRAFGGIVGLE
jgi:hypothetical protein